MSVFTFTSGMATYLENGTKAVVLGEARTDKDRVAHFLVELSSTRDNQLCDGLCAINLDDPLTQSEEDWLKVSSLEQEITLAAITAYRDWLDGLDGVFSGLLMKVTPEAFCAAY